MAEELVIDKGLNKEEKYKSLYPQIKALLLGENDLIANMANVSAALKASFDFFWVGFYLTRTNQLVLGPFQGPVACTRINFDKGVCGAAYSSKKTIIVPNVEKFPGHIACSSLTKSEIVVPGIKDGRVIFVLDVDSDKLNDFDEVDQKYLADIVNLLC